MYKITSVRLDGIRGFNKATEIELNEGLTVFHGPNGTGKSSILQAIEWCITGAIPYMRGGDFTKEDAIVNAFTNAERAKVELSFTGPQNITLSRTKKRTRSTSSGKHQLVLDADKPYRDVEAEAYLESAFNISMDEVSRSKFLHQETIRDALTYKPTERSAVIEKLLGTYEIKEFTKALDQKRQFTNEIKTIEVRIESLQRDRIQFILNLRRSLDNLKKDLREKGYRKDQLSQAWIIDEVEQLRKILDAISSKLHLGSLIHPVVSPTVESLLNANIRLQEDTTTLDRKRMDEVQTRKTRIVRLSSLIDTYRTALEHFKQYETLNVEALEEQKKELDQKIQSLKTEIDETQKILTLLPSRISAYKNAEQSFDTEKENLKKIVDEYGDVSKILGRIIDLRRDLERTKEELTKYSGQQRIVNLAADLIQSTLMTACPVCRQSINATQLVNELQSQVSSDISDRIGELNNASGGYNSEIEALNRAKETFSKLTESLTILEGQYTSTKESLEELVDTVNEKTDLDAVKDELLEKVTSLQPSLSELHGEFASIDEKIRQHNYLNQQISETRKKLQVEVEEEFDGKELMEAVEELKNTLTEESSALEDTAELDNVSSRSKSLSEVLDYLRDKERTENAEKELPELNKQLEDLEAKRASLLHLSGALSSIRSIMTEYQKEASLRQIHDLEDLMNEYYSAILGHPYYKRIKIDIEKQDPLQFSFRAASDREATYIPTRFSTSQLNVVALSIFMSNCKLMAGNLPLLTLDDPTQNMDNAHKEAFSKLVSRLTNDFQVIVATEDDETKDYLQQHCKDATYYKLRDWGSEGPTISLSS